MQKLIRKSATILSIAAISMGIFTMGALSAHAISNVSIGQPEYSTNGYEDYRITHEGTCGIDNGKNVTYTASQIALQSYREKNFPNASSCIDCALTDHILNPRELLRFTVTREMAAAYCKEIGLKFFGKKWHDKTVIISI